VGAQVRGAPLAPGGTAKQVKPARPPQLAFFETVPHNNADVWTPTADTLYMVPIPELSAPMSVAAINLWLDVGLSTANTCASIYRQVQAADGRRWRRLCRPVVKPVSDDGAALYLFDRDVELEVADTCCAVGVSVDGAGANLFVAKSAIWTFKAQTLSAVGEHPEEARAIASASTWRPSIGLLSRTALAIRGMVPSTGWRS